MIGQVRFWAAAAAMSCVLAVGSAVAQNAGGQNATGTQVRGTVVSFSGQNLSVKGTDGKDYAIKLADNFAVSGNAPATMAEITPDKYVGVGAARQPNGTLKAVEVHIFPTAGSIFQNDWNVVPNGVMTNAIVAEGGVQKAPEGNTLSLKLNDRTVQIEVPPGTTMTKTVNATAADIKPGRTVTLRAQAQPDGTFTARGVQVDVGGNGQAM